MTALPLATRRPLVPDRGLGWPVVLAFAGYPVLYLAGLGMAAWAVAGAMAVVGLLGRHRGSVALPPLLLVWLAFLGWTVLGAATLDSFDRAAAFGYRGAAYLTATAIFLWIYNAPRDRLPDGLVVRALAWFWVGVAIGGVAATIAPTFEYTSPVQALLPRALLENRLIAENTQVQLAEVSRFLGFPVGRPEAPFAFTNAWGSHYALLLPTLLASWRDPAASARWRRWTRLLLVVSFVPVITSLNRGLWLSLAVLALAFAARSLFRGDLRGVAVVTGMALMVALVLAVTPLGSLAVDRAETGHSDEGRLALYSQSIDMMNDSPLVGHGAPQPNLANPDGPSVGTHGQFWLVLVSSGLPGAALYTAFMVALLLAARRWEDPVAPWAWGVLLVTLVTMPFYEHMPTGIVVQLAVGALVLRGLREPAARPVPSTAELRLRPA